ncbi:nose resistant to fluoxetine protein 6-like [Zerene cesonia]|uniref:nose resistant to fluoxetine protein 6-like n=1 Tax=Zerene cesonia TaxID=33412 RepID=UPI0018E56EE2|nr:nose resistant to fluoxetine protein 6-like [Zerene cesonia]
MAVIFIVLLVVILEPCASVIFHVNETEYNKMPPLFAMDNYDQCMSDAEGMYCIADFDLFSRRRSSLMHFIQEYSAYTKKHYNHTQLHRGICITRTCKTYLLYNSNKTMDLNMTLEGCFNKTIWDDYNIEAKLSKLHYCKKKGDKRIIDKSDIAVFIVYVVLILLHFIGSSYDIIKSRNDKAENKILLAFSLKRNWAKLTAPSGAGPEPRLERLKMINGMRSITMIFVIFSHTAVIFFHTFHVNPLFVEKSYDDPMKQIAFNGTLVTYTFLAMSSFLLVYNFLIYSETHDISWWDFPKGVFLRWIRLTPSYALVLATIATWIRHAGDGPLWDYVVVSESDACRIKWWKHMLYVNNYFYDHVNCLPQTWYLAADTQLFCLGLLVLVAFRTQKARKIVAIIIFLLSLVITGGVTYFNKLDVILLQTPENYRTLYANDDTFKQTYVASHANLSTFVLGFAAAMLAYHWQVEKKDLTVYKRHGWVMWLLFPTGLGLLLSGGIFYIDGIELSQAFKAVSAVFMKVAFISIVCAFMIGCIFKFENLYRCIVEWRGFTWTGRISYSAFLLHTIFQRCLFGIQMSLIYLSDFDIAMFLQASLFTSYLCGVCLYLFVEAPVGSLVKALLTPSEKNTVQAPEDK